MERLRGIDLQGADPFTMLLRTLLPWVHVERPPAEGGDGAPAGGDDAAGGQANMLAALAAAGLDEHALGAALAAVGAEPGEALTEEQLGGLYEILGQFGEEQ